MPTTTDDTPTPERVRVSSYQARIERSLTDIFFEVPTERQAGREWILTHVAHTNGYAICELCGHNPIKRLFFIKSNSTGRELMIGSECARNYADVDLIDSYMRRMVRTQNRRRRMARNRERTDQIISQRAAFQARWRSEHPELVEFLAQEFGPTDRFLASMQGDLRQFGRLTDRQTATVENIRRERADRGTRTAHGAGAADPLHQRNAFELAADADELPQIYNGTYTVTDRDTREHMTFQIYTPQRGRLQGKRIVKVMRQYSRYEGFGFVGRNGALVVWRRYADHVDQPYVQWAMRLMRLLAVRDPGDAGDTMTVISLDDTDYNWTIERTRSCRRCNRPLTTPTSIHAGIGPECQRQVTQETSAASQRTADAPRVADANFTLRAGDRDRSVRRVTPRSPVVARPGEPLLLFSELGTGEEL